MYFTRKIDINNSRAKAARKSLTKSVNALNFLTLLLSVLFLNLCGIQISNAAEKIVLANPPGSVAFGSNVVTLPNGNIVVVDSNYGNSAGAVYLYRGSDGALISTLTGSLTGDRISNSGVEVLPNGNYVLISPNWRGDFGAVTFCDKSIGCSGMVSAANSLIGSAAGDLVGYYGITILPNSNYVISSPRWGGQRGAVTWGSGLIGVKGEISNVNSLVGVVPGDLVGTGANGSKDITSLNNGNYVVVSSSWNNNRGAATFCNGSNPCSGNITSSNSLVGTNPLDSVGLGGIVVLANSNYVVRSYSWSNDTTTDVGAITWGNGVVGISGQVSPSNSLIGSTPNARINGVTPLTNGNYVAFGADGATFGNGTTGVSGAMTVSNSLVGTRNNDFAGTRVYALTNGNYVVVNPEWNLGSMPSMRGAVTWGNGVTGISGVVSSQISLTLTGSSGITILPNGNYVVINDEWNLLRGAVTWGNGTGGTTGEVSSLNSFVGINNGDQIGRSGVFALTNGNYVICSPEWKNTNISGFIYRAGAVTFANGNTGIIGSVSPSNSLIGTRQGDSVGNMGIIALPNGNYVVQSSEWNDYRGAATFGSGTVGVSGELSGQNSLVGSSQNDRIWNTKLLANGNYVVFSQNWNNTRGSATFGNALTGISGEVSPLNSLVGSMPNDRISSGNNLNGITALPNGNYVVQSPSWMNGPGQNWVNGFGAVTFGNGTTGTVGYVSRTNSLVGTRQSDSIGSGDIFNQAGITVLHNNMYVIFSPLWDNNSIVDAGAITIGKGNIPITGEVNDQNSVKGTAENWGVLLKFAYDSFNNQIVVGNSGGNKVTLFRYENEKTFFDFDGDGKADVSVFRPSDGTWYLNRSQAGFTGTQFGFSTDKITPADFDGDERTDIAVFRDGIWYWLNSSNSSFNAVQFGIASDIPVPADYTGDGRAELAVYRGGTWYTLNLANNQFQGVQFGIASDKPVPADYDGDGKADIAVVRQENGFSTWYILGTTRGFYGFQFGTDTDKLVPADYDGDRKTDAAVYRNGFWYVLGSAQGFYGFQFGLASDIPVAADYDGDGKADAAVYREGIWYMLHSQQGFGAVHFGTTNDKPIPAAYVP